MLFEVLFYLRSLQTLSHQSDVLTAFIQRLKSPHGCVNAMCALCHRLERHEATIILNMHKDNAAAWRLYSTLCERLKSSITPSAHWWPCVNLVSRGGICTKFDKYKSNHEMYDIFYIINTTKSSLKLNQTDKTYNLTMVCHCLKHIVIKAVRCILLSIKNYVCYMLQVFRDIHF